MRKRRCGSTISIAIAQMRGARQLQSGRSGCIVAPIGQSWGGSGSGVVTAIGERGRSSSGCIVSTIGQTLAQGSVPAGQLYLGGGRGVSKCVAGDLWRG